jgi:phage gpG-like protein
MAFKSGSNSLGDDIARQMNQLEQLLGSGLPNYLEDGLADIVEGSFQQEMYMGELPGRKWDQRKVDPQKGMKRDDRRALLFDKGELRRSIDVEQNGDTITVGSDSDYAQIHNEGLKGKAYGKHPFKMPQRQFMPIPGDPVPALEAKTDHWLDQQMDAIFG